MTQDPYLECCLHVQAIRRLAEGRRTPLATAMGVAADIYPHQIGNVLRVLTDVRIRHLLADEVGLGKTIQALMVLNALRYQNRNLRALVVVPDRLVPQWRDEIMLRAHRAPFGGDDGGPQPEGEHYVRLAWEAQVRQEDTDGTPRFTLSDIDPFRYDVLVVDELHRLTSDFQNRIVRVAPHFQHLLVLTATPAFQQPARHAQLFALLEPARIAWARWNVAASDRGVEAELSAGDDLAAWPEWAAAEVVQRVLAKEREAAEGRDELDDTTKAMLHCSYRRVVRTRRVDFQGILPRREHWPMVVEPIGAEGERQALMWKYFGYLDTLTRSVDPVKLAKRVVLSPPSLEQRVDFLIRFDHDRESLLERVKPLVHRRNGDSRADALLDLLESTWAMNPDERVLVAAQDNLTVDYLYEFVRARLPVIGPLADRRKLVAARIRQGMTTEAVSDLGGADNATNQALEAFQRGNAQLLIAPEVGQVGLNLQCARVLVLYSVPWKPEEVEQWIGRLDRIGNTAIEAGDGTTIDIYTIAQNGLVDHKVVDVLARFKVFERGINLDGDHLEEVADLIEKAALDPEGVDWERLESTTEEMAAEDEAQEFESPLKGFLPWDAAFALREYRFIEDMAPLAPVLSHLPESVTTGPHSWDRALEGLTTTLKAANEYHIRSNTEETDGSHFKSLWYTFGPPGIRGYRPVLSRVLFTFGANPNTERHPSNAHAFITRRDDIGTPPKRHVTMKFDQEHPRPLRFLNFGNPLHDELVEGWIPNPEEGLAVEVVFYEPPAFWQVVEPGLYLLRAALVDPARLISPDARRQAKASIFASAENMTPEDSVKMVQPFARALHSALEADERWLRWKLEARMQLDLSHLRGDEWRMVDDDIAHTVLNPLKLQGTRKPEAQVLSVSERLHEKANLEVERMQQRGRATAGQRYGHMVADLASGLATRIEVVREEGACASAVAGQDRESAELRVAEARRMGNPGLITRRENELLAAEDRLAMTEQLWAERERWLKNVAGRLSDLQPEELLTALIMVRRPN